MRCSGEMHSSVQMSPSRARTHTPVAVYVLVAGIVGHVRK
jgi:hypothetical protein